MSAYLEIDGAGVTEARLSLPRIGAWTATVRTDSSSPIPTQATLRFLGGAELVGTVVRGGVEAQTASAYLVGGRGGLGSELPPKFYRGCPWRLPLQDALSEAGESLSASSDGTVLARQLTSYIRLASTAGVILTHLARLAGATWRVLPDGAVRVGSEAYAPSSAQYELLRRFPAEGRLELDVASGLVLPGTTIAEGRVSHVEVHIGRELRTHVWLEGP